MQGMPIGCQKIHADAMLATNVATQLEDFARNLGVGTRLEWPHISPHIDPTRPETVLVQGARRCLVELQELLALCVLSEYNVNFCANVVTTLTQLPSSPAQATLKMLRNNGCLDVYMLRDVVLDKFSTLRYVPYDFLWESLDLLNYMDGGGASVGARTRVVADRHAMRLIMNENVPGGSVPDFEVGAGVESVCFVDVHPSKNCGSVFIVDLLECCVLHVGVGISTSMKATCLEFGVRTRDAIARCIGCATKEPKEFVYKFVHAGGGFKMKTRDYGEWQKASADKRLKVSKEYPQPLTGEKIPVKQGDNKLYPFLVAVVEAHVSKLPLDVLARVDLRAYEWDMVQRLVAAGGTSRRNAERLCAVMATGQAVCRVGCVSVER
jgi:hypothetical protein